MSKSKKSRLTDPIRQAMRDSGLSYYRISHDTGIVDTSLIRFMNGQTSLRLDKADQLAEYFDLELVTKTKRSK